MNFSSPSFIAKADKLGCALIPDVGLGVEGKQTFDSAQEAEEWFNVRCQSGASGWAQFSGVNLWVDRGRLSRQPDGLLLAAEFHIADGNGGASHHLRHDGERWIAIEIGQMSKTGAFLETRTLLHKDGKPPLTYEVAWEPRPGNPGAGLRPNAFRFVGKPS